MKRVFTGRWRRGQEAARPDLISDDEDDRGFSNTQAPYFRRQAQFLLFKIISQFAAYFFYVTVSPMLREEPNAKYYTFVTTGEDVLDNAEWRNSMYLVLVLFLSTCCSVVVAYWVLKRTQPTTYRQITTIYCGLFARPSYYGFVFTILMMNGLLAFRYDMIACHILACIWPCILDMSRLSEDVG